MRSTIRFVAGAALAVLAPAVLAAFPGERSGKEVVEHVCAACHATGANGAPRIGDTKAWEARSKRGLSKLTATALQGVRRMPPHGGSISLNDIELKRAITYMVNQSGGSWVEPIDRRHLPAQRSGEQIVKMQCVKCHGEGLNGAPKIGDKAAWIDRAKLGFDSVVRSSIQGHGAMPSRGGMPNLTDAEMRAAVTYMFQQSASKDEKKPVR
ncbi:MAG: cytochrome c5 family protein [Burkholderiales bacterium]|nr:cytochrome c5 family protein [Burkholderiales bacterium]